MLFEYESMNLNQFFFDVCYLNFNFSLSGMNNRLKLNK